MKKIITSMIVAVIGISVNAAAVSWSVDYSYIPGTTNPAEGYSAYWFDVNDVSAATAAANIAASELSFLTSGYAADDVGDSDGYFSGIADGGYASSQTVTGYVVIFNAGTAASADSAFITSTMDATTGAKGQAASMEFGDLTATQSTAGWSQIGNVPEPTSGLLMLLGMAGLALRRRRA